MADVTEELTWTFNVDNRGTAIRQFKQQINDVYGMHHYIKEIHITKITYINNVFEIQGTVTYDDQYLAQNVQETGAITSYEPGEKFPIMHWLTEYWWLILIVVVIIIILAVTA